jgi:hypothetical protein
LTKDEVANFFWKRFAKPDAQSVTKDEVKAFAKQRMATMRAKGVAGRRHKPHTPAKTKAGKKEEAKPKDAKPAAGAAEPKKAEVKPVAGTPSATAQTSPQTSPVKPIAPATPAAPVKPAIPATPQAAQNAPISPPVKKPAGVSKVDAGSPLGPVTKNPGSKILSRSPAAFPLRPGCRTCHDEQGGPGQNLRFAAGKPVGTQGSIAS